MDIKNFQRLIQDIYGEKDSARGIDRTFVWLVEEIGELARVLHRNDKKNLQEEFADCLAWLATVANLCGVDLTQAIEKYAKGCPRCHSTPCICKEPS